MTAGPLAEGDGAHGTPRLVTFVVRVIASSTGAQAVVELVRTGRKTRVDRLEGIGEVIAAMTAADDARPTNAGVTPWPP